MATLLQSLKRIWDRRRNREPQVKRLVEETRSAQVASPLVDIAPHDPIITYFLSAPGAVEIDKLHLDSPALHRLKEAGVKLAVPLVSQGELVGLLNLGPRRSEQEYSADDRGLLNTLAAQASPAVRVAQMVREQHVAALEHERLEQELRVARLIQQTLLPKDLPALPGWTLSQYYMPARAVGGDFYDFLYFPDGRLGIVIGDVTDKGVPAALVMATTRSILRTAAQREIAPGKVLSPGEVLKYTNDMLHLDIPPKMFVTCLYAILDPQTGHMVYANAGHDLPYRWSEGQRNVSELRATGMPLGLFPGMAYEEKETIIEPGEHVLFYSDGLVEAHRVDAKSGKREMFGFPRLMQLVGERTDETGLISYLLDQLKSFTGEDWEQEDDVTLVTLHRTGTQGLSTISTAAPLSKMGKSNTALSDWQNLAELEVFSTPGNERMVMEQVASAVAALQLPKRRLEQLKTAVAEATMNAMEHGNKYQPDLPVIIQVVASERELVVRIQDRGGETPVLLPETPDIEAKLTERQKPRGWGLFLIKNLVDEVLFTNDGEHHTVELIMHLEEDRYVDQKL